MFKKIIITLVLLISLVSIFSVYKFKHFKIKELTNDASNIMEDTKEEEIIK